MTLFGDLMLPLTAFAFIYKWIHIHFKLLTIAYTRQSFTHQPIHGRHETSGVPETNTMRVCEEERWTCRFVVHLLLLFVDFLLHLSLPLSLSFGCRCSLLTLSHWLIRLDLDFFVSELNNYNCVQRTPRARHPQEFFAFSFCLRRDSIDCFVFDFYEYSLPFRLHTEKVIYIIWIFRASIAMQFNCAAHTVHVLAKFSIDWHSFCGICNSRRSSGPQENIHNKLRWAFPSVVDDIKLDSLARW